MPYAFMCKLTINLPLQIYYVSGYIQFCFYFTARRYASAVCAMAFFLSVSLTVSRQLLWRNPDLVALNGDVTNDSLFGIKVDLGYYVVTYDVSNCVCRCR